MCSCWPFAFCLDTVRRVDVGDRQIVAVGVDVVRQHGDIAGDTDRQADGIGIGVRRGVARVGDLDRDAGPFGWCCPADQLLGR